MLSQGASVADIGQLPSHNELQKVYKFFNYTSLLGCYNLTEAEVASDSSSS